MGRRRSRTKKFGSGNPAKMGNFTFRKTQFYSIFVLQKSNNYRYCRYEDKQKTSVAVPNELNTDPDQDRRFC